MIDIHCHILPYVDDGPETIDDTRRFILEIKNQGIEKIIQTTHINEINRNIDRKKVSKLIKELKDDIPIIEGYEVNISHIIDGIEEFTIDETRYILVEFSPLTPFSMISELIKRIKMLDLFPIIAHIERFTRDINRIRELKIQNVFLQINAETFLKDKLFQKAVLNDLIDFIASDFHPERKYLLKEAFDRLKKMDAFLAEKIFLLNPDILLKKEV